MVFAFRLSSPDETKKEKKIGIEIETAEEKKSEKEQKTDIG